MDTFHRIDLWGETHHPKLLDLARIALGITLATKGFIFIYNRQALHDMAVSSSMPVYTYATIYPRALTLLVSGMLISFGLITRIACIFELPWAIGAVIFAGKQNGFFSDHITNIWINILILLFVIVFLVAGSGPWSVDESMRRNKERDRWAEELDRDHLQHL